MATNLAINDVLMERARRVGKLRTKDGNCHTSPDRIYPAAPTMGDSEVSRYDRIPEGMGLQKGPSRS
jgi:hypothetical protein